jgi:uncharacterized protein with PIN domain
MEGKLCAACGDKFLAERASQKELEKKIEHLKREATETVVAEYEQETKQCAQCKSVRKCYWKGSYCDEHRAKVNAEIDARYSEIDAKFGQVSEPLAAQSAAPDGSVEQGAVRVESPAPPGVPAGTPASAPDVSVEPEAGAVRVEFPAAPGVPVEQGAAAGGDGVDEKAAAEREAGAFQHFAEEMKQCKDCKCALQSGMPCSDHQTKITLFLLKLKKEVPAALFCQKCRAVPASVDSRFCDGCTKKLQAEELEFLAKKQKKEDAWRVEYEKEQAAKTRKFAAEGAAMQYWHPVTSRCKDCISTKKAKLLPYCDEHQRAIDETVEKQLAGR